MTGRDCAKVAQDTRRWLEFLRDECGFDTRASEHRSVHRCQSCMRNGSRNQCMGAHLSTPEPVRLNVEDGYITVGANTRWGRSGGDIVVSEHSVEVAIWRHGAGGPDKQTLFCHADFASPQVSGPEPIYHMQFGGYRSDMSGYHRSQDSLRWPAPPFDLVLATELLMYSYCHNSWQRYMTSSEAIGLIRTAEEDFVKPFFGCWQEPMQRSKSFIGSMCCTIRR